jgi:mono/diheme cytochrome c family protein
MRLRVIIALIVIAVGTAAVIIGFNRIEIDALHEPSAVETFLATNIKKILIARSSGKGIAPAPTDPKASAQEGETVYGTDCSMCHGMDGHSPTDNGRWMYPRAADLTSPTVQQYSDRELFWIIKNGIRLTGMPAFGKVESDANIWNLVNYLRALPGNTAAKKEGDSN